SQDGEMKTALAGRLVALLTDRDLTAPPLLRLGDPRPGVCTLEPDLIPIPAGPFLMGEEKDTVTIQEPYAIGRYPVTNAQFQMFVDDGGYMPKWQNCWTAEGWQWCGENGHTRIYELRGGFIGANQPVLSVSWYEAVAYSRWLAAKTGNPYRLPTEAEWERAARHTDGRTYPWGETWQDGIANTKEAELGGTTAVGVFPGDTAVCGALDMGGNVWEWCQTRRRDEKGNSYPLPYRHDDGREELAGGNDIWRETRGGVYAGEKKWSRCSARFGYSPDFDLGHYGFRLALSPFFDSGL
ncbi:MAG: SUMF1/EgtB/PvdO family nonheme iron enzyme, partial [Candidatus Promineifilaceae bacterium]